MCELRECAMSVTVERTSVKARCNTDRGRSNRSEPVQVPLYPHTIPTRTATGIEAGLPRGEANTSHGMARYN
jgi:hypothetical protein